MVQNDGVKNHARVKIAFLSAGLGNILRGFEISCCIWFHEINNKKDIEARLFSGGRYKTSTKVWNCPRNGFIAKVLRCLKFVQDGCRLEQLTFSFGFLFYLIFYKPHIIWLQEATLANMLLKFRKIFKLRYELVFCDGAPVGHNFAKKFDYLIFLHQCAMDDAICEGVEPERCCVIPHLSLNADRRLNKIDARLKMNIGKEKFVIICVAAWNKHHKRIDYLLNEIASLNSNEVILLLCGQPEKDSMLLKDTAAKLQINVEWHTFSQEDLSVAYFASDLFVLPSLNEALGAVLIEAGSHGLPVICHPHQAGKYIFGEDYNGLTNLSENGNLAKKIKELQNAGSIKCEGDKTQKIVSEKFDREKLTADFVKFINHVCKN
ncbi:MAG: a-glycosyltransferase-related protein glycosyltransferase family 4 protein [Mucilaginibacter sp.]|nr:a-glycosyltransferase-related protein glycosyltransferase family 4 protein [Mucilaginibacter sp.]